MREESNLFPTSSFQIYKLKSQAREKDKWSFYLNHPNQNNNSNNNQVKEGKKINPKQWDSNWHLYISSFQMYKLNGEQKFWPAWAKAHSAGQTQMVSLQFLWLTVPSLMKCCGVGLQNCKYNEWDANLSHWFLFCRHGKPLLITLKVCQDWVEKSF